MNVVKRNGDVEPVSFDQILERIRALSCRLVHVDPVAVAQRTIQGLRDRITTRELDALAAETAAYMSTTHPEYGTLAARISLSNLAKEAPSTFLESATRSNLNTPTLRFIDRYIETLEAVIDHTRDDGYDYFAFKTLERAYLRTDSDGTIVERPQYMLLRIAVGIHCHNPDDIESVLHTYELLSTGRISHATPTMFNAGTQRPQMASCFLMTIPSDSIQGIFEAVTWSALISQHAGGIGINAMDVRGRGSRISGSGGKSNGLVPMLQVFDRTARYVDQGGGKRKGAIAIYLEPWHPDIFEVLELKKNHGKEELRARDLFYGLWVPDLFMRRVDEDGMWSLICPHECPTLATLYGTAFDEAYAFEEQLGTRVRRRFPARELWAAILDTQIETGTPYILFKDACNSKSNHKHLGPLRCSNLCTEILEYVSPDEVAVCNLASIALPRCVVDGFFNHSRLETAVRQVTRNLNRVIDGSFYPILPAETSNRRHRPIGIGVQGLADVFHELMLPFDSDEARLLNRDIFETIYYAALSESVALAATLGPYESYEGSPLSSGQLQPDLWGVALTDARHDWTGLRASLAMHGARNSLLVAPMPTASTAQILGNTEAFEPTTSNMYTRRVLSGEFAVVNARLVAALDACGKWSPEVKQAIIRDNGSIQNIDGVSDHIKLVFRTVWEIKMRAVIDMAADRAPFIDQGMSMNLFMESPSHAKLTSALFHAWRKGLKNGIYYLRIKAAAAAAKVTVDACPIGCTSCSA